jgi:hypothetical protein
MAAMEEKKEKRINYLRSRFGELSGALEHLRSEWLEARSRHDIDRETELINQETKLFRQVNEIIGEYAALLDQVKRQV